MASNMQFTVGPPPYDSDTVITDGVVCYKCAEFWTTSWMGLYMHLRHHCLTEDECLLLPGSYLVQEATREQSTASSMQFTAGPPPHDRNTRDHRRRRMLQVSGVLDDLVDAPLHAPPPPLPHR